MKVLPSFKRGDFFSLVCVKKVDGVASSVQNYTITAQVRSPDDTLLTTLTVTKSDQNTNPGRFELTTAVTSAWPITGLRCDIQFADLDGKLHSTETFTIPVLKDETR